MKSALNSLNPIGRLLIHLHRQQTNQRWRKHNWIADLNRIEFRNLLQRGSRVWNPSPQFYKLIDMNIVARIRFRSQVLGLYSETNRLMLVQISLIFQNCVCILYRSVTKLYWSIPHPEYVSIASMFDMFSVNWP